MLTLDEFESRFRSADKPSFELTLPEIKRVAVVTDLPRSGTSPGGPFADQGGTQQSFLDAVKKDLEVLGSQAVEWVEITNEDYDSVNGLLSRIDAVAPDLVVAYRNLKDDSWRFPYSLGPFLNVLTRETGYPVIIVPNPNEVPTLDWRKAGTDTVMVITDHLAGDRRLVNWGVRLTAPKGTLWLTHIEDDEVYARYMSVIGRIASIPTELAIREIHKQLLKEPEDYIDSIRSVLDQEQVAVSLKPLVKMGHRVQEYRELVEGHQADLLCLHSTASDESALHGASYLLAVELRTIPILML